MIVIEASTISEAWRSALVSLWATPASEHPQHCRDMAMVVEVGNSVSERFDPLFPMSAQAIARTCAALVTGETVDGAVHEETLRYYRPRLFGPPDQIAAVIAALRADPFCKRAQASVWLPEFIDAKFAPCLQVLWFQVQNGRLATHVHLRGSDAFAKLLMNLSEFGAVGEQVAASVGVPPGPLVVFLDSAHIYRRDEAAAEQTVAMIRQAMSQTS